MSVVNLGNGSPKRKSKGNSVMKKSKGGSVMKKMSKGGAMLDPKGMRNGGDASRSAGTANPFKNPRAQRAGQIGSKRGGARRAQMMGDVSRRPRGAKRANTTMTMPPPKLPQMKKSKGGSVKKPKG